MTTDELARELVAALRQSRLTLGTCESLTGGGVAAAITRVPGASAVYRGGLVTYASDLKASLAGVDAARIAAHGVINQYTAGAMAQGAREVLGADLCIACTGVAGPDPQDGEQPGTVWLAVAGAGGTRTRRLALSGDRWSIQAQTADELLSLVLEELLGTYTGPR